jgi:hypothetical protein
MVYFANYQLKEKNIFILSCFLRYIFILNPKNILYMQSYLLNPSLEFSLNQVLF